MVLFIVYKNRQEKARLLKRAQRDALTGLYNKKTTQELIERSLEEGEAESCNGLLIMDVDYFKQVNDTYGHIVGDKVLKTFGHLLARQFREHDIAGRIGGDEFMVLIRNINNGSIAENRVKKLIDEVRSLRYRRWMEMALPSALVWHFHRNTEQRLWNCTVMQILHCIR